MYKQNEMDNIGSSIEALFKAFCQLDITQQDQLKFLIEKALDEGIDINVQNNNKSTFLHKAILYNKHDVAKFLLEKKANPNILDDYSCNTLHKIAENPYNKFEAIFTAKLLLQKGALTDLIDSDGHTPISYAVLQKKTEIIKLLIQYGVNLDPKPLPCGKSLIKLAKGDKPLQSFLKLATACRNNDFSIVDDSVTSKDIEEFKSWKISITPEDSKFFSKHLRELYCLKNFLLTLEKFKESKFINEIDDNLNLYGTLKNLLSIKIVEHSELYKPNILSDDLESMLEDWGLKLVGNVS